MIEPPLPFGNAAARWYYVLLKGLVERGHKVTAFAACSHPAEIDEALKLFPAPAYDLRCYVHPHRRGLSAKWDTLLRPYSYMFSKNFQHDLECELAKGYDILHLEQLWSGWMGLAHADKALLNVHYLSSVDLNGYAGSQFSSAYRLACRAERHLLRRFPRICVLTTNLGAKISRLNSQAKVEVVPLGMDLKLYKFRPRDRSTSSQVVSLIGSFNWAPTLRSGIRILTRLWPAISRVCPEARLRLIGRNADMIRKHVGPELLQGVSVLENVPDTLPYFYNTDVLLYPAEQATGMKVKVMEAFALGVPVVTTQAGVEGLPACDGMHAGIAEDDAGLIERTLALLQNPDAWANQSTSARKLIEKCCSSSAAINRLILVYQRMSFSS